MIRRNVASQVVYLPALLLKADGAAVTTGATLTVAKDGIEAASAGTLAHSAGGVWKYTPAQAETDCAMLSLVLTATDTVPVVLNLVTTAADTSAVAFGANTVAPLDAAGTRSAMGLAAANLDTQLGDLPTLSEFNARSLPSADYFVVGDYTAPDNTSITAVKAKTDNLPTDPADASDIAASFSTVNSSLASINSQTGTTIPNLLLVIDSIVDAIKLVTDKLDDTLEDDLGTFRFTTNALEQAPAETIDVNALATAVAAALAQIRLSVQQQLTLTSGVDLRVIQGDDYTRAGSKLVISLDTSGMTDPNIDLSAYKLVICGRNGSSLIAVRMPIAGTPGAHTVEFDPPSSVTETWATGSYDLLYRIEWASNEFTTLSETGILRVDPFDIEPADIVDI